MSSFSPREADIRFLYSSPDIMQNSGFDFVIFAPHFLAWFKGTFLSKTSPAQNNTGRLAICQGHSTLFCGDKFVSGGPFQAQKFGWLLGNF